MAEYGWERFARYCIRGYEIGAETKRGVNQVNIDRIAECVGRCHIPTVQRKNRITEGLKAGRRKGQR